MALLAACSFSLAACHKKSYPCRGDADCAEDQVCFADGCGDPARGIRVEATPSTAGRASRDIALNEVHSRQDLQLSYPPMLEGSISALASDPPRMQPYSEDAVAVRGQGESEIIPGLTRTFEITLPTNDSNPEGSLKPDGTFNFGMSPGVYSITVSTLDPHLPPALAVATTTLRSGEVSMVDLSLGPLRPPVPLRIQVTGPGEFDAQAFSDAVHLRPLSQRVAVVAAGQYIDLSPAVRLNPTFVVQVSPRDPAALVPRRTFGPFPTNPIPPSLELAMGDYGAPVSATGTILDARGAPIADVTVYIDGPVGGGGTFRSQSVQTNDSGYFALTTLASASGSTSNFWAIPPAQSGSGILRSSLAIRGTTALGNIACPDKVIAQGNVYRNDESSAPGVRVMAAPIQQLPGRPLPGAGDQTTTDETGAFSLQLDPAIYRLDFIPGGQLPRTSRFAAVPADPAPSGGYRPVQVPDVFLSKARKITGLVSAVASQEISTPSVAPLTRLRFFRVTTDVDGRLSSILLAETVTDATGSYSVYLPTR